MRRRVYLVSATAAAVGIAGCGAFAGDENGDDDDDRNGGSEDPVAIEQLDDFEDLDRWETVMGALSGSGERVFEGNQSAVLEANGAEQIRISRTFEDPIDATGMNPGMAVANDGIVDPTIQLIDGSGDWFEYRQLIHANTPFDRYNFGLGRVVGDPDPSAIEEINIVRWVGDEPETVGPLYIDDLHLVPRPSEGMVVLQFAGGHETTYTHARPTVDEHDLEATAFVPPAWLRQDESEEGNRMTVGQLESLADAGWTIASQTYRDQLMTGLNPDEQEADIVTAVEWLEDNGYAEGARFLSYPAGRYDESSLELANQHHDLAYAGAYPSHGHILRPALTPRVLNPDVEAATRALDLTATYGGLTSLAFYGLQEDEEVEAMEAAVEALADHVAAGDLQVVTPATVADEYVL